MAWSRWADLQLGLSLATVPGAARGVSRARYGGIWLAAWSGFQSPLLVRAMFYVCGWLDFGATRLHRLRHGLHVGIGFLLPARSLACYVADLSLAYVRFFIYIGDGGPLCMLWPLMLVVAVLSDRHPKHFAWSTMRKKNWRSVWVFFATRRRLLGYLFVDVSGNNMLQSVNWLSLVPVLNLGSYLSFALVYTFSMFRRPSSNDGNIMELQKTVIIFVVIFHMFDFFGC